MELGRVSEGLLKAQVTMATAHHLHSFRGEEEKRQPVSELNTGFELEFSKPHAKRLDETSHSRKASCVTNTGFEYVNTHSQSVDEK